ncbi:MAG: hypothetical protein ACR2PK_02680 [Acidimicrobiales bacterium]
MVWDQAEVAGAVTLHERDLGLEAIRVILGDDLGHTSLIVKEASSPSVLVPVCD